MQIVSWLSSMKHWIRRGEEVEEIAAMMVSGRIKCALPHDALYCLDERVARRYTLKI